MTKTFEFVYSSSTFGVLIGTLVKTGVTREQIFHPWGHRIQEGWQLCKYNFYMSLSQFFFPMNHGKNLIIHMRFERGEFYYISNGGDRNYSEK